jgi:predicted metal-dependent phosphoesterase TrpH
LIDLHTHTTASDGRLAPVDLVARASAAGVTVLSVTDHDTTGAAQAAAAACAARGIEFVPGIEITAIIDGADLHVLGYFLDPQSPSLEAFLHEQRERRMERVRKMIARLGTHGISLDADAILARSRGDKSTAVGRPWIARAMVRAGHVSSADEAFERWLARGRPAYVPREGAPPEEVFARIHEAGGIASLAHPVHVEHDEWLPGLAAAGLDALEAYHTDHDAGTTRHYVALASRLNLAVTGGSDYHGDDSHGGRGPGSIALPQEAFEQLKARRASKSG